MFPETDEISNILSDTVMVLFKRRLVDRVLRLWIEISRGGRFPRRDQIEPSMLGEDWANCLVIAVRSPIQLSYFVAVGKKTYRLRTAPTIAWQACSCRIYHKSRRSAVA